MTDSTLIRSLGPFERLFYMMSQNRSTHFVMAFEVSGHPTLEAWRSALNAVQAKHPLLSCYVTTGSDDVPEFHSEADTKIPIRVVEAPSTSWISEAEKEFA